MGVELSQSNILEPHEGRLQSLNRIIAVMIKCATLKLVMPLLKEIMLVLQHDEKSFYSQIIKYFTQNLRLFMIDTLLYQIFLSAQRYMFIQVVDFIFASLTDEWSVLNLVNFPELES